MNSRPTVVHDRPANQRMMSARLRARKVITLDASHASLASRAKEIAGLIEEALG